MNRSKSHASSSFESVLASPNSASLRYQLDDPFVHPPQVRRPFGGVPRLLSSASESSGIEALEHDLLELHLVAQADQRAGQGGQGPVEVRRVGLSDQLVDPFQHAPGDRDADQAVDHEGSPTDMAAEGQAGLDRLDGLVVLPSAISTRALSASRRPHCRIDWASGSRISTMLSRSSGRG